MAQAFWYWPRIQSTSAWPAGRAFCHIQPRCCGIVSFWLRPKGIDPMCTLSRNRFLSTLMALVVPAAGLLSFASLAGPRLYSQEGVRPKAKSPKIEKMLEERLATVREMVRIV